MKLHEIHEPPDDPNDTETSVEDMIITRYELGQITYEQAAAELKNSDPKGYWFWEMELNAARDLKENPHDSIANTHVSDVSGSKRKQ